MTIIEGTVKGRENRIFLKIRDRDPNKVIEPYLHDKSVVGMDLTFCIVTPMGKVKGKDYLQAVITLEIAKKDINT